MDIDVRYVIVFNRHFAGSCSLASLGRENGFAPFHYVQRQAVFGGMALIAMFVTSMMSPILVRRLAVLGFVAAFIAVALLPVFGTDFGKGAVRWYALGFASLQPSEFLNPGLWWSAHGCWPPPRKSMVPLGACIRLFGDVHRCDAGPAARFYHAFGVVCLGCDVFRGGCADPFVDGHGGARRFWRHAAYQYSEHFARRIDGFLPRMSIRAHN